VGKPIYASTGDVIRTDPVRPADMNDAERLAQLRAVELRRQPSRLAAQPVNESKSHKLANDNRVLKEAFDRMKVLANIKKN